MRAFGREIRLRDFPRKAMELARMGVLSFNLKHPHRCWAAYIHEKPPLGNRCVLRNGWTVYLSSNPHDIITVMVNFCRQEYGKVKAGSTVVDIGGNIGVFSLYAAMAGAKKIIAFEPNREAYEVFTQNIHENQLLGTVEVHRRAVGPVSNDTVFVPSGASPYNQVSGDLQVGEGIEPVLTTSLEQVFLESGVGYVDLLKLDCEGAEYGILLNAKREVLGRIGCIRMELHSSKEYSREQVVRYLEGNGFSLVKKSGMIYWFDREKSQRMGLA